METSPPDDFEACLPSSAGNTSSEACTTVRAPTRHMQAQLEKSDRSSGHATHHYIIKGGTTDRSRGNTLHKGWTIAAALTSVRLCPWVSTMGTAFLARCTDTKLSMAVVLCGAPKLPCPRPPWRPIGVLAHGLPWRQCAPFLAPCGTPSPRATALHIEPSRVHE